MAVHSRRDEAGAVEGSDDEQSVAVHQTRPGRLVFTEAGHADAWIATDIAVVPDP